MTGVALRLNGASASLGTSMFMFVDEDPGELDGFTGGVPKFPEGAGEKEGAPDAGRWEEFGW